MNKEAYGDPKQTGSRVENDGVARNNVNQLDNACKRRT